MERYQIRVVGHLAARRTRSLECAGVEVLPDGDSVLTFDAIDQSALYGLLSRLRDLGIELVDVERAHLAPPTDPGDDPGSSGGHR